MRVVEENAGDNVDMSADRGEVGEGRKKRGRSSVGSEVRDEEPAPSSVLRSKEQKRVLVPAKARKRVRLSFPGEGIGEVFPGEDMEGDGDELEMSAPEKKGRGRPRKERVEGGHDETEHEVPRSTSASIRSQASRMKRKGNGIDGNEAGEAGSESGKDVRRGRSSHTEAEVQALFEQAVYNRKGNEKAGQSGSEPAQASSSDAEADGALDKPLGDRQKKRRGRENADEVDKRRGRSSNTQDEVQAIFEQAVYERKPLARRGSRQTYLSESVAVPFPSHGQSHRRKVDYSYGRRSETVLAVVCYCRLDVTLSPYTDINLGDCYFSLWEKSR